MAAGMQKTKILQNVLLIFGIILLINNKVSSFDCNDKSKKLQVHIVPHSHDDVGWLKTVDEYFYGAERLIQAGSVQYILDTVIDELQKNPNRTFIYVEIAFFKRWWDEKNNDVRNVVKKLVKNKQLEFINGGWSMNDEGATHYNGIIDQMTLGLLFIDEHFGVEARPTVAWQIDPFGHSAEQASLFSLMSFDGLFFGRLDEADKQKRKREQRMEMVWRGSRNYEEKSQIFTGVLYNGYNPPPGFCYDEFCEDPPIQDDPRLYDNNVKDRVDSFVEVTCEQAEHYKTNHIILTMGSDFQYENALRWFVNLDKLIKYVNQDGRINVFYSSPSRYLKALHDAKLTWEVKTDDFFPYAHCDHCYWTGYFTSRPTLKGYIRDSNNVLQACKQIEVLATAATVPPKAATTTKTRSNNQTFTSNRLRRAMAVNQHHDAVTGTEKQPVAYDYAKRLHEGREDCKNLMNSQLKSTISNTHDAVPNEFNFTYCDHLNVSACQITEKEDSLVVNVYNPIGRTVSTNLRVPVNSKEYIVFDAHGNVVTSQISRVSVQTASIRHGSQGSGVFELTFQVESPPLGYSSYFIERLQHVDSMTDTAVFTPEHSAVDQDAAVTTIENEHLKLEFSPQTGRLVHMSRKDQSRKDQSLEMDVEQQFFWYNASTGNKESIQTSGAYIFRPNKSQPLEVATLNKADIYITKGPVYQEIKQVFGVYVSQVVRLYKNADYAEFEHTVGPIPVADGWGKEIITRFDTNIQSGGRFYTDANGREMKLRVRDHRETWKLNVTEPVAGNYYPVNSRIFINDTNAQLCVMSDRSQGGGSITDGSIEIMVHRRLLRDDFLGVGEPLNEPGSDGQGLVTRGKHRVLLSKPGAVASDLHRQHGELMMMAPLISFSKNPYHMKKWNESFVPIHSSLETSFPKNIHLLSMETINKDNVEEQSDDKKIILRFENFYESYELNEVTEINLDKLFKAFRITSLVEMNLSANQEISKKTMMDWIVPVDEVEKDAQKPKKRSSSSSSANESQTIEHSMRLKPMEIRTFVASIKNREDPGAAQKNLKDRRSQSSSKHHYTIKRN